MASELPSSPPLSLIPLCLLILFTVYKHLTRKATAFDTLPWAGLPPGKFPKLRAYFSFAKARETFIQAFKDYSQHDRSFIWQPLLSAPMVMVPPSQIPWLINQPDTVLNSHDYFSDIQLGRGLLEEFVLTDHLHEKRIRTDLTRTLGWSMNLVADEVQACLEDLVGSGTAWRDVCLRGAMTTIFARTSSRVFIGLELTRNPQFINSVVSFSDAALSKGVWLRPFPEILRPVAGLAVLYPNRKHCHAALKLLTPVIEQRKADIARAGRDPDFKPDEPVDFLQWLVHESLQSTNPRNWDTTMIGKRYLATSNAAIHTTSIVSAHVLMDLAASPPSLNAVDLLRDEISQVRAESHLGEGDGWTKASLAKLVRLDSTIRESMRHGALAGFSVARKVIAPQGLTLPDGAWMPYGSHIAAHVLGAHFVEGHERPEEYDPFRFSRPREEGTEAREKAADGHAHGHANDTVVEANRADLGDKGYLQERNMAASATGTSFLTFGHGRHACPGRFFAITELKVMLAEVLTNYEVQPVAKRPENIWYQVVQLPDAKVTLKMRKRAG